jgi:hypothetical protein
MPATPALLKWRDGRVEFADVESTATTLQVCGPDGQMHEFVPTEDVESGRDVYVESTDAE